MTTIAKQFAALQTEALARWRGWAAEIAAGGEPPAPVEVLEAGAILEIAGPMQALETDAHAIREVAQLQARADAVKDQLDAPIRAAGGADAIRERIAELRAELKRLEVMVGGFYRSGWSAIVQQIRDVQRRAPRVFPERPAVPAATKTTKSRRPKR